VRARRFVHEHRRGSLIALILFVVALVGVIGLWYWLAGRESTDDAQVDAQISQLSARVAGTVTAVHVQENDKVKKGTLLVTLDPRDYQVALARAQAELALEQAQLEAAHPNVPITETSTKSTVSTTASELEAANAGLLQALRDRDAAEARIREARANNNRAQIDLQRYRYLVKENAVPRSQLDEKLAAAKSGAAAVDTARAEARSATQRVEQAQARLDQAQTRAAEADKNAPRQVASQAASVAARQASVKAAQAAVDRAKLDLEYTKIVAPADGRVGRRAAQLGQHILPGQELFGFVETGDLWITAYFKETQLRRMRPGQRARVHVDAFDRDYGGVVESLGAASGARFSLLPPENATGNFVKVVQRLPVRIRLDEKNLEELRPGMSVVPTVFLR
jgi:membrane fusion protein (multidrug efflux system)